MSIEAPFTLIPKLKVHPHYMVTFKECFWTDPSKKSVRIKTALPESNKCNGIVSDRSAAKIRKAISWLLYLANDKNLPDTDHGRNYKFKLSFITLTMSSQQHHSDTEIKTKCLNHFLVEARKKWNVVHYLWRAEPQKNGNIHFHILCDKFIPWSELRDTWNRIQNKLGYVDCYRNEMRLFHNGGFKVREDLLKKWSYKNQIRAYREGSKKDWNSPNSTDIHSVLKIKNLPAYLAKYCTKNQKGRQIEGNVWNLSESLSKCDGFTEIIHQQISDELNNLCMLYPNRVHHHDFYTIIYLDITALESLDNSIIFDKFQTFVKEYQTKFT